MQEVTDNATSSKRIKEGIFSAGQSTCLMDLALLAPGDANGREYVLQIPKKKEKPIAHVAQSVAVQP